MIGPDDETKASTVELRTNVNKTASIPNNPENNVFYNAFTSVEFKARVEAGLKRVIQDRAESGFSILSNSQEIIYTPLELGGQLHQDSENVATSITIGMEAATEVGFSKMYERDIKRALKNRHQIISVLHFHPHTGPFSDQDIQYYDNLLVSGDVGSDLKSRPDLHFGVFIPPQSDGNGVIPSLKLFMFSGPSSENFYQSENFDRLRSTDRQREVLEKSGMKVVLVELPTPNGRVNLDPLKAVLR